MMKINIGDMFKPSYIIKNKKQTVTWKSSKYFIIEDLYDASYKLCNDEGTKLNMTVEFMNAIWHDGLIIKVETDEERAKLFLLK